jgi:hypothetical protein
VFLPPVFFARRDAEDAELLNHEDTKEAKEERKEEEERRKKRDNFK